MRAHPFPEYPSANAGRSPGKTGGFVSGFARSAAGLATLIAMFVSAPSAKAVLDEQGGPVTQQFAGMAVADVSIDGISIILDWLRQMYIERGGDPNDLAAIEAKSDGGWSEVLAVYAALGGDPSDLQPPTQEVVDSVSSAFELYLKIGGDPKLVFP